MEDISRLREENQRLKRAVDELTVLNELASAISAMDSFEEIVRKIIGRSLRAVGAEQGVITLVGEPSDLRMRTLVRTTISSSEHGAFHFNEALLGWMMLNKKPLTLNDPPHDERFRGIAWDTSIQSLLCVPMLTHSAVKGVLTVYNKKTETGFSEDDQRLLAIIASQSAQVVENARLCEEERTLMQVQRELKLASQIQADLLPKEPPTLPGYDIAGATFPARTVGGDYFDFITIDERRLAICLGDVSGKGLPAALLVANLQASLRGQAHPMNSVRECICGLNRRLYESTSAEKFATLFYGVIDSNDHSLTYCNAGQEPPFLFSPGAEPERLQHGGTVIGIADGLEFRETRVQLKSGDILVACSDGVTEAMDEDRRQFGENTLAALIKENAGLCSGELIDEIVKAVRIHTGNAQQHDDITAVVVKRTTG